MKWPRDVAASGAVVTSSKRGNMARKPDTPCAGQCGKLLWSGRTSLPAGQRMCLDCRRLRRETTPPPQCSEPDCTRTVIAAGICAVHYSRGWRRANPEKKRADNARRRALERNAPRSADTFDTHEIYERDGWKCGLCGLRVGRSYSYPHPRSASLDHIVPLSQGGEHTRENVQLAHLCCNSAKRNRGNDQLRLIG